MRLIYLFVLIIFLFTNIMLFNYAPYFSGLELIHLLPSLTLLIIFIGFGFKDGKNRDWTAVDNIFIMLFYLFHFAYLYLYYLGKVEYNSEVFWNDKYIYPAIYLATIAASSFLIGFNLSARNTKLTFNPKNKYNLSKLYKFSKLYLLLSLMLFWLPIFTIISYAFTDYKALISVGALSPIGKLYWIGQYIGVGSLALYYLTKAKLKMPFFSGISSFMAFGYILGYLIIGDRGGFLFYGVIPLITYNLFYKKINLLKGTLVGVIVLSVSSVIAVSRNYSVYNPIEAYQLYAQSSENSFLVDALREFGSSFKTIPMIMSYIPEHYEFWNGKSYVDSFLLTLPNFGENRTSMSIAAWLTERAFGPDTWGRGGSILMESYGNFGMYGSLLFFLLLGLISGYLYNKYKYSSNIFLQIMYIAFVSCLCLWMRNTSTILFRTVLWSVVMIGIAVLVTRYLPKKSIKQ